MSKPCRLGQSVIKIKVFFFSLIVTLSLQVIVAFQNFEGLNLIGSTHLKAQRERTRLTSSSVGFDRVHDARFCSPLLEEGYPPVVEEYESGAVVEKPLLVFLPGFDGTFMTLFLQLPELSTSFDVRCLTIGMSDRSTYEELKSFVLNFVYNETQQVRGNATTVLPSPPAPSVEPANKFFPNNFIWNPKPKPVAQSRAVYVVGESFGGILAADVTLSLLDDSRLRDVVKGMTLINAATCYDRSKLASMGPTVAKLPQLLYPFGLIRLLPLFTDEHSLGSLLLTLQAKALPSVIDSEQREAFMGRIAFSIPSKLKYMSQETLKWRLTEWLEKGCSAMESRLERFGKLKSFRTLIVAGEKDLCLPSIGEAERLSSIFYNPHIHVVEEAGHASTCGSRIDLAAILRNRFPEIRGRKAMKPTAAAGKGPYLGMEPRYDAIDGGVGLSPLEYWSKRNYRRAIKGE